MFSEYVGKAIQKATYELIEDGTYFGEIPGFDGVWGNGKTIEECRSDLIDSLEGWLILGLWDHDETLPVVEGTSLIPRQVDLSEKKTKKTREATPSSRARKAS
jgi:predicted RNase H-like HicB family nuclease